ncbi:MAG TPA: RNase H [Deltaproteobacteria bacterium]|nr:RNase H [Deltaproteobacteria bacterium]HCY11073.1 RNase H [Deltaproteobacteria bacterium]
MSQRDDDLARRFLKEISKTLDVCAAAKKVGITEDEARSIFKGLAGEPVQEPLFKAPVSGLYEIRVDGASRGNPGQAGAGAIIKDPQGNIVRELRKYLGVTTNNMAEYHALVMALTEAVSMGVAEVEVFADSELMVKQVTGVYRVKSEDLRPLFEEAKRLFKGFRASKIVHVYREENSLADKLANEAIERRA